MRKTIFQLNSTCQTLFNTSARRNFARAIKPTSVPKTFTPLKPDEKHQQNQTKSPAAYQKPSTILAEEQATLQAEMHSIQEARNHNQLLKLAKDIHRPTAKVQLLSNFAQKFWDYSNAESRDKMLKSEQFQNLVQGLKAVYNDKLSDSARNSVLYSLLKLKYRDTDLLDQTCDLIANNKVRNINTITNILYILAKFKYTPKTKASMTASSSTKRNQGDIINANDSKFMKKCVDLLKAELVLPIPTVCRNLWNFYALQCYDKELFDKFGQILIKNQDMLNEIDVANAVKSFAYFKHMNYEVLECLIRTTIKGSPHYKLQTLAVISNSLADLDVKNMTFFNIVKTRVLKEHISPEAVVNKEKQEGGEQSKTRDISLEKLKPIDCAQFMTAFCRVKLFDIELMEVLEHIFVKMIDLAEGETLVTMFTSHAAWSQDMIEQCLIKKSQPRKVYNYFKKYNEEFYEHMAVNLIRNIGDINLKGIFLVLAHGNMAHLKKRSNVRLMRQFAVKGIETIKDEKASINDDQTFEVVCAKYYEYSVRYCLNKQDREELHNKFKTELDIDIVELVDRISPLGFKFKFTDELPKEEDDKKAKKIKQAVEQDENEFEQQDDEEEQKQEGSSSNANAEPVKDAQQPQQ